MNKDQLKQDVEMLSHFNRDQEIIGDLRIPEKITLVDATIREGEQGTAAGFTLEQKMEYVRKASAAGVELIQVPLARDEESLKKLLATLTEAGAHVLSSTCDVCLGVVAPLADGNVARLEEKLWLLQVKQ